MNLQEVLACLEDAEKRRDLIEKLKNAGEHSKPFLNIRDALIELRMNKAPRGIDETTIMQHTFRFLKVDECFQQLRLVCKPWKHAIETMRFNRVTHVHFEESNVENIPLTYVRKYLRAFRKLNLDLRHVDRIRSNRKLILDSMTKLNSIRFVCNPKDAITANDEIFITRLLENSKTTLQSLYLQKLEFANELTFPKLNELDLCISEKNNALKEFEKQFPIFLSNNNVEVIGLDLWDHYEPVCEYIRRNHSTYCISGDMGRMTNPNDMEMLPLKICTCIWDLQGTLENRNNAHFLEYLHFTIPEDSEDEFFGGWDRYQELFDKCINLKAIELTCEDSDKNFVDILPTLSPEWQEIWKEKFSPTQPI